MIPVVAVLSKSVRGSLKFESKPTSSSRKGSLIAEAVTKGTLELFQPSSGTIFAIPAKDNTSGGQLATSIRAEAQRLMEEKAKCTHTGHAHTRRAGLSARRA